MALVPRQAPSDRAMTEHINHARLIRPFDTKRLAHGLHQVIATGNEVNHALNALLVDPPTTPEAWCQGLQRITGLLHELEDQAVAARVDVVEKLFDRADEDFETGLRAVSHMMRGLGFAAGVPVSPEESEDINSGDRV